MARRPTPRPGRGEPLAMLRVPSLRRLPRALWPHRRRSQPRGHWTAIVALLGLLAAQTSTGQPAAASVSSPPTAASSAPQAPATTGFVLPVPPPPVVLTAFARPANRYGPGHRGVDLAASAGAEIHAAGPGVVVYAADLAGRGVVSIEHAGGLRTTYEPVTASVNVGDAVRAGQLIGTLQTGHAGCAPADCLHWGARLPDRVYLDPMTLLTGWDVRLLPWDDP